jgi:hypothetical protein
MRSISMNMSVLIAVASMSLLACGKSEKEGAASASASGATAKAGAAEQGTKVPELVEMKNEKRQFSFQVPKGTKADASGDSYSWDTMQILVEIPLAPIAKVDDLMQVVVGSLKEGAKIESKTEGDVLIASWKQPSGPMHMVCGQTGKSVVVRVSFEPTHKEIALAMCKSLRTAQATAQAEVDLGAGGDTWKGFALKAPGTAVVADDGAGGISVAFKGFQLSLTQGKTFLADRKAGAKSAAEFSKGKVTFVTDKPEELEYVTETKNADGLPIKGYGFATSVDVAGKKIGCSSVLDDEAQVAAGKAICKSLHKK